MTDAYVPPEPDEPAVPRMLTPDEVAALHAEREVPPVALHPQVPPPSGWLTCAVWLILLTCVITSI